MRRLLIVIGIWVALLPQPRAGAEVVSGSAWGFLTKSEATVAATPDSAYRALVDRIAAWWDPAHTYSRDARNLWLEAKPGGCFCERLPNEGGVRHLEVVYVAPGEALRLTGGLGPLQGSGLAASLTWTFAAAGESTRVQCSYSVGGYDPGDMPQLASAVDGVLHEQLLRLARFVDTGRPEAE